MSMTTSVVAVLVAFTFFYLVGHAVYDLCFHGLARIPGPKLWAISKIPWSLACVRGKSPEILRALHERYGDVIRLSPNELSFIGPCAMRDIYGANPDVGYLPKDPSRRAIPPNGVLHLQAADPKMEMHIRQRRLIEHAFSASALRDQEPILQKYSDQLLDVLSLKVKEKSSRIAINNWFNYTTFDISGDLTLGESFGCLEHRALDPWIAMFFNWIKFVVIVGTAKQFPGVDTLLKRLTPKRLEQATWDHFNITSRKVDQRLALGSDRRDFIGAMLKNGLMDDNTQLDKETSRQGMSREELHSNAGLILVAGSETTSTCLSACTYYLCKNPRAMERLTSEIRNAFRSEDQITLESVAKLPYLTAALKESLRMFPPVAGWMFRQIPAGGAHVSGIFMPGKTIVTFSYFAAFQNSRLFAEPAAFIPERWIGEDPRFNADEKEALKPFSIGPSNCIGERLAWAMMRLIMAKFLFKFDVKLCEDSIEWRKDQNNFIVWQQPALNVELTER